MKKKPLPTASEIIFPEVKEKKEKVKGAQQIHCDCPDCNSNDVFDIVEVLKSPQHLQSGLYRCKCTVCGFEHTIQSKTGHTGASMNAAKRPTRRYSRPTNTFDEENIDV